jgi:hypothetical protein
LNVISVHGRSTLPFWRFYIAAKFRRALSSLSSKATVRLANVIHSGKHYNHIRRRLGGLAVPPKERLGAVFHEVEFGITQRLRKEFVF